MKKRITIITIFSLSLLNLQAQWTISGTGLYTSNTGNVGVGTGAVPTLAKFQTKGSVSYTTALFGQDLKGISLTANNPGVFFNSYRGTGGNLALQAGFSGNLQLDANTGRFIISTHSNATAANEVITATERMTVLNNGNVGIGNTSPNEKLVVSGGIIVDKGNVNGGVLTASALSFGTNGTAVSAEGICSKRTTGGNYKGLDFITNSIARLSIANAGGVSIANLAGTGSRMVIASSTGLLSSQTIPVSSQWVTSGANVYYNVTNGKVGIGTTTPLDKLDVAGGIIVDETNTNTGTLTTASLTFGTNTTTTRSTEGIVSRRTTGGNYKGLDLFTNSLSRLSISNAGDVTVSKLVGTGVRMVVADATGKLSTQAIPSGGTGGGTSQWTTNSTSVYYNTGNVGIGIVAPAYKLDVCGTIRAKEVRVQSGWCDYVFEENYDLMPLESVKDFIQRNKHLPNVTPAKVIETEGLEVGNASREMIRKIEELTLYMIEQNETLKAQNMRLTKLEQENMLLKAKLEDAQKNTK